MSKYIIEFSKTGTICFTSHLDLMRIWQRVFKRTGVPLAYSQGFNPHPKMGFAQPLSLGYWSMEEYIEFETAEVWEPADLLQRLAKGLPEGIDLKCCLPADHLTKTLASHTRAAEFLITIPLAGAPEPTGASGGGAPDPEEEPDPRPGDPAVEPDPNIDLYDPRSMWDSYMGMEEIQVWKRQKKKKEPKKVDIRPMIRQITFQPASGGETDQPLYVDAVLDCGSDSNLSPELVISSLMRRFGIGTDRSQISVMRKRLIFDKALEELL